jgi:hypothetical protein
MLPLLLALAAWYASTGPNNTSCHHQSGEQQFPHP